jgi:hypothetical protein
MKHFVTFLLIVFTFSLYSQAPGGNKDMLKAMKDVKGRVYGKVLDAKTKKPVEFASVVEIGRAHV